MCWIVLEIDKSEFVCWIFLHIDSIQIVNSSDAGDKNIPALIWGVNILPADALAPKVARASAGMVLIV